MKFWELTYVLMRTSHFRKKKLKKVRMKIFYFCQMWNESTKSIEIIIAMKRNAIYHGVYLLRKQGALNLQKYIFRNKYSDITKGKK